MPKQRMKEREHEIQAAIKASTGGDIDGKGGWPW